MGEKKKTNPLIPPWPELLARLFAGAFCLVPVLKVLEFALGK